METNRQMDAIRAWQSWYYQNQENSAPLPKTVDNTNKEKATRKATEYFADTIAEFLGELDGKELFQCLLKAAKDNYDFTKKEYDKAREFLVCINEEGKKELPYLDL